MRDSDAIVRYPGFPATGSTLEYCGRILAERARDPGVAVSNSGGAWHSPPDLALRPGFREFHPIAFAAVSATMERLGDTVPADRPRWGIQLWAMVYPARGYSRLHHHAESDWSLSFTLDPGDATSEDSAVLAFRAGVIEAPGPSLGRYRTERHDLVVFPGRTLHEVSPYLGTRPRVVLSANVFFSAPT